jgi:hypothetical protein
MKKTTLERARRRWENSIKMDLRDVGLEGGGGRTGLVWIRIVTDGGLL